MLGSTDTRGAQDSTWNSREQLNSSDGATIKSRDFEILTGGTYLSNERHVIPPKSANDPVKRLPPSGDTLLPFPRGNVMPAASEPYHDPVTASADIAKSFISHSEGPATIVQEQDVELGQAAQTEPRTVDKPIGATATGRKRVTKSKPNPRPKVRRPKDEAVRQPDLDCTPSEEDLLNLLAYRYHKDREVKENDEAILRAKNLEVEELRRNLDNLEDHLAESERKITSQDKELGRYREAISKKVGKLTKFVNGLAEDHNQLRNDAKLIVQKQDVVRADGIELIADVQGMRVLAQDWARRLTDNPGLSLREARQKIDQLEEVVGILNRELEDKSGLLAIERDRTVELEANIKLAGANHDEVKALMDRHHEGIVEKLNILPSIVELARAESIPGLGPELRMKVEECVGLLKVVHDSSRVLPEKFLDILSPVRVACGESVTLRTPHK